MRREKDVTVTDEGRDQGKTFHLTEMSASQAEDWAVRVFLAMMNGGVEIPEDVAEAGLAGLATLGLNAFTKLKWQDAQPLLAEMMKCVKVVVPAFPMGRPLVEEDIEEVATRLRLKVEVFNLHTGFSIAGGLSTSGKTSGKKNA